MIRKVNFLRLQPPKFSKFLPAALKKKIKLYIQKNLCSKGQSKRQNFGAHPILAPLKSTSWLRPLFL